MSSERKADYTLNINTILSGIYSVSCQHLNVKVELFYSEQKTSKNRMDYVYFNRCRDNNTRWTNLLNEFCERLENKYLQTKLRIYGCIILADNYESSNDIIIQRCIMKCFLHFKHKILNATKTKNPILSQKSDSPATSSSTQTSDKHKSVEPGNGDSSITEDKAFTPTIKNYITNDILADFQRVITTKLFISSKIHSVSCQKDHIKVELALCDAGTATERLQRVYINKLREHDRKWTKHFNNLWQMRFSNDNEAKHPVYLLMITHDKTLPVSNEVVSNCIKRCLTYAKSDLPS